MSKKRSYGEACAMAHALDLVGERWALHVVRELLLGPKRFTDLRAGITHVSPNVLSERLRELESSGVVSKRRIGPPVSAQVYELTEWGRELEPAVQALGRWGARSPHHQPGCGMSIDSHVMAMRTMFDPQQASDLDATLELRLGADVFCARVTGGEFSIERKEGADPDVTVETEAATLAGLLWGGLPPSEADVTITGDHAVFERFLVLFPLPDHAPAPAGAVSQRAVS
jgi:DNA-binding HxlR family transcriptional regulator